MVKESKVTTAKNLVPDEIIKGIDLIKPIRLYLEKEKKKVPEGEKFRLRNQFFKLSDKKQQKYFQKSVDKFIDLLEEHDIDIQTQQDANLFNELLNNTERKKYFDNFLNAPCKPAHNGWVMYQQIMNQENGSPVDKKEVNIKWKLMNKVEQEKYRDLALQAHNQYEQQVANFANILPERIKAEYLSSIKSTLATNGFPQARKRRQSTGSIINAPSTALPKLKRSRQSVSAVASPNFDELDEQRENGYTPSSNKLTKDQLVQLHQCLPSALYYNKKVSDEEKQNFNDGLKEAQRARLIFDKLKPNKRRKWILKAGKKWTEFLETHTDIITNQIPTLHLLLSKQSDRLTYFYSIGLPERPPVTNMKLYSQEHADDQEQIIWTNIDQNVKDNYSKRVVQMKKQYKKDLASFIQVKLHDNKYLQMELFHNLKTIARDYEFISKKKSMTKQQKITKYYKKEDTDDGELNNLHQRLLTTPLNDEQKILVQQLFTLALKYKERKNNKTQQDSIDHQSTLESHLESPASSTPLERIDEISNEENDKILFASHTPLIHDNLHKQVNVKDEQDSVTDVPGSPIYNSTQLSSNDGDLNITPTTNDIDEEQVHVKKRKHKRKRDENQEEEEKQPQQHNIQMRGDLTNTRGKKPKKTTA